MCAGFGSDQILGQIRLPLNETLAGSTHEVDAIYPLKQEEGATEVSAEYVPGHIRLVLQLA